MNFNTQGPKSNKGLYTYNFKIICYTYVFLYYNLFYVLTL